MSQNFYWILKDNENGYVAESLSATRREATELKRIWQGGKVVKVRLTEIITKDKS